MNASLREEIYRNLDIRETDDLIEIWQTNDRLQWSDEAFEVISEILRKRGIEPPAQNEPVLEHDEDGDFEDGAYGLTEQELRIVDDEEPPDFYDPFQVITFGRWINAAAFVSVVLAVAVGLIDYQAVRNMLLPYFAGVPNANVPLVLITLLVVLVEVVLQSVMTYFPLKVLAHILRILMEMEFNSRKPGALGQSASEN